MQREDEKISQAFEVEQPRALSHDVGSKEYKMEAIEAENAEYQMTVLQAVKAYPMASFWAFVMSCTIVSPPLRLKNSHFQC